MKQMKCNVLMYLKQSLKTKANSFLNIFPLTFLLNSTRFHLGETVFQQHAVAANQFSQITSVRTLIPLNQNPKMLYKNKSCLHFNSYGHKESSVSREFMCFWAMKKGRGKKKS